MLVFKNNNIRVRCIECYELQFLTLYSLGSENSNRNLGIETEYYFRGESNCRHCSKKLFLITTVYEFPTGQFNYIDKENHGCLIMDVITEDSFLIT